MAAETPGARLAGAECPPDYAIDQPCCCEHTSAACRGSFRRVL